ncbi:MAG: DNA polymerase III subunit delta [Gemmatimonadales bacterium]
MATLSFDSLLKSLQKGQVPGNLYLYGPEEVLKEELVEQIVALVLDPSLKDFNLDRRSAASLDPEAAETLCMTLPMMADRRIVIVTEVEAWNKRARAKGTILRYLEHPAAETVLILVQSARSGDERDAGPDKDLAARATAVAVEHLPAERAQRWLERRAAALDLKLEPEAARHLVKVADAELSILRSELDKLAGLGGETLTVDRVAEFLGVRHGETAADWIDFVIDGDAARAARVLPHLLAQSGVSAVALIASLGTHVAGIGLARCLLERGTRGGALAAAVKQSLFRSRPPVRLSWDAAAAAWSRLAPRWPMVRVEAGLATLRRADERLKNTTIADDRAILFDVVMELIVPWQQAA